MESTQQVLRIEQKVQQLLKQYQLVQKENLQLQKENAKLRDQLQTASEAQSRLQQQFDTIRISSGTMPEAEKKELEKRINTYLKDIDQCLALLHQ